jgi:hypothetical protein
MTAATFPDDWWPDWLRDFGTENPAAADPIVAAAIEESAAAGERYRQYFTALVPLDLLDDVLDRPGGIGYRVSASGPHPSGTDNVAQYTPRFWVESGGLTENGFEPLVAAWWSGNHAILWPDQGFLMTYGLVPQLSNDKVHWHDLTAPQYDIVVSKAVSTFDYPHLTSASVSIARDFLEDYATIRNMALVQVYYLQGLGPPVAELLDLMGPELDASLELRLPGRLLDIRAVNQSGQQQLLAQVWGVRALLVPGRSPVSRDRWEYGRLTWPGYVAPITRDDAMKLMMDQVYIRDSVLEKYEGRQEYVVHPESGAVSHGDQWSVGFARRVGRDLIALELKKLYEGNRPETVRHWNSFAVPPPTGELEQANVATRTKRIVFALASLGETIALLAGRFTGTSLVGKDVVGLDRQELSNSGWWSAEDVERVSRHIPLDLKEGEFFDRCRNVHKLVVESLAESRLRELLTGVGVPADNIKGLRSLKLLDRLVQLAIVSARTGLSLTEEPQLSERAKEDASPTPIQRLLALNELRILASHRSESSSQSRIDDALKEFGLTRAEHVAGWGLALDAVYDGVAEALEAAAKELRACATLG